MLKTILDLLWVVSSMSLYLLFFKISNISAEASVNILDDIQISKISIPSDYLAIVLIAFSSIMFLQISKKFIKANDTLEIKSIKVAEPTYIPVYVAYFVIAMSISSKETFIWISIILVLLIWATKMFYFNPILLLFRYHFYEIQDKKDTNMLLISKQSDLKGEHTFNRLHRLNNFTFLDLHGD